MHILPLRDFPVPKEVYQVATFYNQAILSYNNSVTNSNIVTGELLEVLTAAKTAVQGSYRAGDDVTYVISIVNSGAIAYTGLTVADDLGTNAFGERNVTPLTYSDGSVKYYINGVLQTAPTVTAGPPLVFTGINVPANGNAVIVYTARVNEYAPLATGGTITNTATVSGGGLSTAVTATATLPVETAPQLTVTKSVNPTSVVENGELTYTFVIQNLGNTEAGAGDNAVLTDTFDPVLNITSVTFNGTAWSSPTQYNYDASTGAFATVAGAITIPAATYTQNPDTGAYSVTPGIGTLTVTGTI